MKLLTPIRNNAGCDKILRCVRSAGSSQEGIMMSKWVLELAWVLKNGYFSNSLEVERQEEHSR